MNNKKIKHIYIIINIVIKFNNYINNWILYLT